ncbi:MAG: flagellar biosynthesis protein FlhF [Proteobacteria bacterium]|nr:flagellar biosynthesis protein FlhF [Pseudomonadota bacterium]MBU1416940.1 flagellar biosynthesis protein FlhF [Pseudomonadota bacterium]MBU1456687.1 flagellar biosynthesis protein FlhF [Pseudomonadota bacterium]
MQVKVFESSDMATGLQMIKKELGPDALILSTKTIRSGKLGLLGKPRLEITAAIDSAWPSKKYSSQTVTKQNAGVLKKTDNSPGIYQDDNREELPTYNSSLHLNRNPAADPEKTPQSSPLTSSENNNLQSEVNELKSMIKNLAQEMNRINVSPPISDPGQQNNLQSLDARLLPEDNRGLRSLHQRLLDYGIGAETAQTISNYARETLTLDELSDPFKQQEYLAKTIYDLLNVQTDIFPGHKRQHRLALVGPTGVGKTTTLAKIAADYLSKHSASIALITIDTYRIAAVEQLKVYGEIMNLPVEVVLNPEQLEQMLLKHRDKELILIDTAGRSPQDTLCIEELASFLSPDLGIQKHLVLSATTREKELFEAMHRFSILDIDNTIITKIDECSSLGLLLDIQIREKVPFSYITNGQRVPEDLLEADKELLTQLIMTPGKGLPNE